MAVLIALAGAAALICVSCVSVSGEAHKSDDLATLNTLAQVAGALFATIVTVVVFAAGLSAQRPDGGWEYMPFVARKYGVFHVAAASVALALADAMTPSMAGYMPIGAVQTLLVLNALFLPVIVLCALWLMCRVIQDASGSDLERTLPVFRSAMEVVARTDQARARLLQTLARRLETAGIKHSPWAGLWSAELREEHRFLGEPLRGAVRDIDSMALDALLEECAKFMPGVEVSLRVVPGAETEGSGILFLRAVEGRKKPVGQDAGEEVEPGAIRLAEAIDPQTERRLNRILRRLCLVTRKRRPPVDVRQFFARTEAELVRLARATDAHALKKRLEDVNTLLKEWIAIAQGQISLPPPRIFSLGEQPFAGPLEIDIDNLVQVAVHSHDPETLEVVIDAICRMLTEAKHGQQLGLFRRAAGMLSFGIMRALQVPDLQETARRLADNWLGALLGSFYGRRLTQTTVDEAVEQFERDRDYLEASLAATLSIIRVAIEAGDRESAKFLLERIAKGLESERQSVPPTAPATETADSAAKFAVLVVLAWCFQMLQRKHREQEAAIAILKAAAALLPGRHGLIAMWELYHKADDASSVEDRLGVERWHFNEEVMRTGIVYTRTGGAEWLSNGLLCALLVARQPVDWELREFFSIPSKRNLWNEDGSEAKLTEIAMELGESLGDESLRAEAVGKTAALIKSRWRAAEAVARRIVAASALDNGRIDLLRKEITDGVASHRHLLRWLEASGAAEHESEAWQRPVRVNGRVHRDYLIVPNNWASGYGTMMGESIAHQEAMRFVHVLACIAPTGEPVRSLLALKDHIRRARMMLLQEGAAPSLLILPREERFAAALFDKPLWEIERKQLWGGFAFGEWEGLVCIKCPYQGLESVILCDAKRVFGVAAQAPPEPVVTLEDASEDSRGLFIAACTEVGVNPLPDTGDMRVDVRVDTYCPLGFHDVSKAMSLDLSQSDGCYAMVPNEETYHRWDCEEIVGEENLKLSLTRRLDGEPADRKPCPTCRPETWDLKARLGRIRER